MEEIWKPVRGFEDWAEVSNLGQIHRFEKVYYTGKGHKTKRIQEEEWTYGSCSGGYLNVCIGGVIKGVHVWVYETFVGDIPKGMDVNHLDEDKHNNSLDNLNLLSHGDNVRYGTGIARMAAANKNNPKISKAVQALDPKTLEVVMEFASTREAQRQGFDSGCISKCCRNCFNRPGNNVYKGLIWRFRLPQ